MFGTWSYQTDRPPALEALRERLRKLPGTVYRAKGVVYTTDAPQRRAVLQVVGRRVDISLQDEWGQRAPRGVMAEPRRSTVVHEKQPLTINTGQRKLTVAVTEITETLRRNYA